jgi:Ca2+-binding RTX toxin-like protein
MRRASILAVVVAVLVGAFAGVAWAAVITCDGTGDQDPDLGQCQGTEQSDGLTGTEQSDIIFALGGFDEVNARAGDDELNGGRLADGLFGQDGNDTYSGGKGADFLWEVAEDCCEIPTTGNDVMNGGPGPDFIFGEVGDDILRGSSGDESRPGFPADRPDIRMSGGPGSDKLFGGTGDDALAGDEGSDELYGGPDNDFINAGDFGKFPPVDEPDLVDGGEGFDTCLVGENDTAVNCEKIEPVTD